MPFLFYRHVRPEHVLVRDDGMLSEAELLTKDRQTYHRWMTDPKLQELTASEPLTYEQEVEMQSWALSFSPPSLVR